MCRGVIAHGGLANRGVDDGIHLLPNANYLPGNDLMCADSLHRVVASGHFGDDCVVVVGVEPSAIADLAAGFGVEGSVIENNLAGVARLELLRALTALDDGEHYAVFGARLAIALEFGFRELLVGGVSGLLGRTFPGSAGTLSLFGHGTVETFLIETNTLIS